MEVPRLGVILELQLPAYAGATAMQDLSHVCNLHHTHGHTGSLTHWVRPGTEPTSSWILVGFVSTALQWDSNRMIFFISDFITYLLQCTYIAYIFVYNFWKKYAIGNTLNLQFWDDYLGEKSQHEESRNDSHSIWQLIYEGTDWLKPTSGTTPSTGARAYQEWHGHKHSGE